MNTDVFSTTTTTTNAAGGAAVEMPPEHALAQYAMTGTFNNTYYANAEAQTAKVLEMCCLVPTEFTAKLAVYSRTKGHMKDMPAFLLAFLAQHDTQNFAKVFDTVVDNGKMLRNFCQIIRSGAVGRKSFGSRPKKMINAWLNRRSPMGLLRASVGSNPTLGDVIKMTHPKASTKEHQSMYAYFIGKPFDLEVLPKEVQAYIQLKATGNRRGRDIPDVPFNLLTSLDLDQLAWSQIAEKAGWQMTRMNLNTFHRHGVFKWPGMADLVASKLRDKGLVQTSRVFPYQVLSAIQNSHEEIPPVVKEALSSALEISLENVPNLGCKMWVLPDVSASMNSPVTGHRRGSSSSVSCVDVAGLVASAFLKTNPLTTILPFDTDVRDDIVVNRFNTVVENARIISEARGGGTDCSSPMKYLNRGHKTGDLIVYVSDNESWVGNDWNRRYATSMAEEWEIYKRRNPKAKLVCIDVQPNNHSQVGTGNDVLNIGGFSDHVFTMIANFANGVGPDEWVNEINSLW